MPIPDFQTLMLPLLKLAADQQEHSTNQLLEILATQFNLTEAEKAEMLPSGTQRLFNNRVHWAKAYLKMGGLIDNTRRGFFQITDRGLQVLNNPPDRIDIKFLKQYEDFVELKESWKTNAGQSSTAVEITDTKTPSEVLEDAYTTIRAALVDEVLSKVKSCSWSFFEELVVKLLVAMGYGGSQKDAGEVIGQTGDEGIDGTIKEDKLGLDVIYIQAKKWNNVIGRPEIQKFVGALAGQGAKKGIFITTGKFTGEAKTYLPKNDVKIILIDGKKLAELMIDYSVGVATRKSFDLKALDNDFFIEE